MNREPDIQPSTSKRNTTWIVLGVFAATLAILCGLIFLFNYEIAYDDYSGAGWLPPSVAVIYYYFLLTLFFFFLAFCLKLIFRKNIYLWTLLLTTLLLPILCYQFNYHTLKKDGPLFPLVAEGGIFHFIAIGDFNFDGINDKEYHRLYEERTYSLKYSAHPNDILQHISTTAIGTGPSLESCFCFYDEEKSSIDLHLNKNGVELKQIELIVYFSDPQMGEKISFYEIHESGAILHPHTINEDGAVVLRFDADTCLNWQTNSEKDYITILLQYSEKNTAPNSTHG